MYKTALRDAASNREIGELVNNIPSRVVRLELNGHGQVSAVVFDQPVTVKEAAIIGEFFRRTLPPLDKSTELGEDAPDA